MEPDTLARDTLVSGGFLVGTLVVIGAVVGLAQGEPPLSFVLKLFTDPVWLFVVVLGLVFSVRGYRKSKRKHAEESG